MPIASKIPRFPLFTFFLATPADSCNSTASVSHCLRSSSRRVKAVHLSLEGPAFPFVYKLPAESCWVLTTSTASVSYCLRSSSRRVDAVHLSLEGSVFPFVYIIPRDAFSELLWLPAHSQASIPPWLHWHLLHNPSLRHDAIWYTPAETTGNLLHDSIPIQCPRSLRYADVCSLRCYSGGFSRCLCA